MALVSADYRLFLARLFDFCGEPEMRFCRLRQPSVWQMGPCWVPPYCCPETQTCAVHFQLEQGQPLLSRTGHGLRAGVLAVPAVANAMKQLISPSRTSAGHIGQICAPQNCMSAAKKLPEASTISPTRLPFSHAAYNPPAVLYSRLHYRRGGERFAQITCRAVGLIRLRLPFAGGFQRRLLLLPVGLCKGVDGIGAADVRLFCLRADPHALPVCLCKPGLEGSGAPCTGLVIFIPQADAPPSLRLGRYSAGRFGVHHTAQSLSARPQRFGSGSYFNFVGGLAHASGTATIKTASRHLCREAGSDDSFSGLLLASSASPFSV